MSLHLPPRTLVTSIEKPGASWNRVWGVAESRLGTPSLAASQWAVTQSSPSLCVPSPRPHFQLKQSGTQISIWTKMVSWETNGKNSSFKTFSLQPREQSHAFHRHKIPKPNSISYKAASSTKDSRIDEKCYSEPKNRLAYKAAPRPDSGAQGKCPWRLSGRTHHVSFLPPCSHAGLACHSFMPVFTDVKHFLVNFLFTASSFLQKLSSMECKQIGDRSEVLTLLARADPTSCLCPLECTPWKLSTENNCIPTTMHLYSGS